ncbi:MAG: hypothetical protein U0073_04450 [Bacteroidia bacterium]
MKRIAIGIFILLFSAFSSIYAQRSGQPNQLTPAERAEKASLRLKSKLNLSDDQTRQVKDLFLKRASADKTNRELMKQQREQTDKELATILTQDQMTAYLKMKDERRANMMQHRRNTSSPPANTVPADSSGND